MKLLLLFLLTLSVTTSPAAQTGRQWRPATFRGITVGKSKLAEVMRRWGKPKWSRASKPEADEGSRQVTWTNYEQVGEFPGPTTVVSDTRTGIVSRINFYPARLTKEQAIAHFGPGYVTTRYAFDSCQDEEESEPLYESSNGPVVSVEYRRRGIAITVGYQDLVTRISYVSEPIGSVKSRCNP